MFIKSLLFHNRGRKHSNFFCFSFAKPHSSTITSAMKRQRSKAGARTAVSQQWVQDNSDFTLSWIYTSRRMHSLFLLVCSMRSEGLRTNLEDIKMKKNFYRFVIFPTEQPCTLGIRSACSLLTLWTQQGLDGWINISMGGVRRSFWGPLDPFCREHFQN